MKILKKIGLVLLAIIVIAGIASMFMATEVKIEKSVTIKAPGEIIWNNLKYCSNFPKWSPWHAMDPNMKVNYTGTDGSVGGGYNWSGNDKVKTGSSVITSIDEMKQVSMDLKFGGYEDISKTQYTMEDKGNGEYTVKWIMNTSMPRPMNIMCSFMKGMIEGDFEKGLNKLKSVCESEAMQKPMQP